MERDLERLSVATARIADEATKDTIRATAKRYVSSPGGLMDHIRSEPIVPTAGIVGVSRIDGALDALPYWRAQNYGYTGFIGRVIKGFFYDTPGFGGVPTPPESGRDDQAMFAPDADGGYGTIQHPLQPRHFLERGRDAALAYWRREQRAIIDRTVREIRVAIGRAVP